MLAMHRPLAKEVYHAFRSLLSAPLRLALFAALPFMIAGARAAHASFTPTQCAPCPTRTEVNFWHSTLDMPRQNVSSMECQGTQPPGNPCSERYTNRSDHERDILANQYVKEIGFRIAHFDLEPYWDFLYYGQFDGALTSISGNPTVPSWRDVSLTGSGQASPVRLKFTADTIISQQGFDLDRARVCCNSTPNSATVLLAPMEVYSGLLLGSNDVVYARIASSASAHITIAMKGDTSNGQDFDLYARCNQLPTPSAFDYRALSGQNEFIHIPAGFCNGGIWYVAVNSWYGAGWFTLVHHAHFPAHHMVLTAGTGPHYDSPPFEGCTANGYGNPGWNPTTSEIAMIKTQLRQAAKIFFGMTEGSQHIARIDFYNNN